MLSTPPGALRRLAGPVGLMVGVAAAFGYLGVVDPGHPGHYPACPVLRFTGVYCPTCGGLRAAHALVHGDWGAAVRDNVLAVALFAGYAVLTARWAHLAVRGRPLVLRARPVHWWAAAAVAAAFTVLRNLPLGLPLTP